MGPYRALYEVLHMALYIGPYFHKALWGPISRDAYWAVAWATIASRYAHGKHVHEFIVSVELVMVMTGHIKGRLASTCQSLCAHLSHAPHVVHIQHTDY